MDLCSKCYKEYLQKMKSSQAENGDSGDTSKLLEQFGLLSPSESRLHDEAEDNEEKEKKDEDPEKEKKEEIEDTSDNTFLPSDMPVQKNRKRCWNCKVKLELAQRALGSCKCGYVFCALHRLPEQHDCIYNHKEDGRLHAMKTMVPTGRKKIGRSFHRMDSRPE